MSTPSGSALSCPACGSNQIRVIDTRPAHHQRGIRRQRRCLRCARSWGTMEVDVPAGRHVRVILIDVADAAGLASATRTLLAALGLPGETE